MNNYLNNIIDKIFLEYNIQDEKFKFNFYIFLDWINGKIKEAEISLLRNENNEINNYNEYFISIFSYDYKFNFNFLLNDFANIYNGSTAYETKSTFKEIIKRCLNLCGFDYLKISEIDGTVIFKVDLYSRIGKIKDKYYYNDIRNFKLQYREGYQSYLKKLDFINYCIEKLENWENLDNPNQMQVNSITLSLKDRTYNPYSL